jgi:menaquinone-dependent protoporphyrinogen oxidase
MRVLVSAASRHGSSAEIARTIGDVLASAGLDVTVAAPRDVAAVEEFDAVVLGSGVYAGHWLEDAKALVARYHAHLAERPVWLFSSGPLGDPLAPAGDPADAVPMLEATLARDHRVFGGRLSRRDLSFPEKLIVSAVRAPEGDFRQWDDIRAWATEIVAELGAPVA